MAWRTSYSAGSTLNAADMNAIAAIGNAWSTWSAGMTGITVGNGSQTARCMLAGKLTMFSYQFTFGSTSAVTGALKITLPATAKLANQGFGDAAAFDTSAGFYYPLFGTTIDVNTVNIWTGPTTAGSRYVNIGAGVPFAWATGDVISVAGVYEAA
jgi:hypothetical protein